MVICMSRLNAIEFAGSGKGRIVAGCVVRLMDGWNSEGRKSRGALRLVIGGFPCFPRSLRPGLLSLVTHLQYLPLYIWFWCHFIMFYSGSLQEGIAQAVSQAKAVVCFVRGI